MPPVGPAIPQTIDAEPQCFRPVGIAGEEIALLWKVVLLLLLGGWLLLLCLLFRGDSTRIAIQHSSSLLLRLMRNGRIPTRIPG